MDPIEIEGPTVADAVENALKASGLRRDQVEIAVLQEESAGFMGLGAKPARVRLTEKRWGPGAPAGEPLAPRADRAPRREPPRERREPRREPAREPRRESPSEPRAPRPEAAPLSPEQAARACAKASALVEEVLRAMTIAAPTVSASWDADLERVKVSVESQDASLLVGRDGRVLESLQFLVTLMLSRAGDAPVAVQVDALSYWEKKEGAVVDAAHRAADSVRATGKPYRLEPMDASMRRLVHRTLASDPEVATVSEGEGTWRKIVVRPRK